MDLALTLVYREAARRRWDSSGWMVCGTRGVRNHAGSFCYMKNSCEKAMLLAGQTTPSATCHLPVCKWPPLLHLLQPATHTPDTACSGIQHPIRITPEYLAVPFINSYLHIELHFPRRVQSAWCWRDCCVDAVHFFVYHNFRLREDKTKDQSICDARM